MIFFHLDLSYLLESSTCGDIWIFNPGGMKFLLRAVIKNPGVICASPAFYSMSVVPSRWSNAIEHWDGLDLLRDALELVGGSWVSVLWLQSPEQPVSRAEDCDATWTNRGKIAFKDSRTVATLLLYWPNFLAMFRFDLDLLQAYNNLYIGHKCKVKNHTMSQYFVNPKPWTASISGRRLWWNMNKLGKYLFHGFLGMLSCMCRKLTISKLKASFLLPTRLLCMLSLDFQ